MAVEIMKIDDLKCCGKKPKLIINSNKDDEKIFQCLSCGLYHNIFLKKELENNDNGWIIPILEK